MTDNPTHDLSVHNQWSLQRLCLGALMDRGIERAIKEQLK